MPTHETNAIEKLIASIVNVVLVGIVYVPFHFTILRGPITFVALFFIYNLIVLYANRNRCVGMIVTKTHWAEEYPMRNHFLYTILYTMSFATLFIWIFFPFDLLLFNMFFLQLPTVLLTKTTLHGYFSGDLKTVKEPEATNR